LRSFKVLITPKSPLRTLAVVVATPLPTHAAASPVPWASSPYLALLPPHAVSHDISFRRGRRASSGAACESSSKLSRARRCCHEEEDDVMFYPQMLNLVSLMLNLDCTYVEITIEKCWMLNNIFQNVDLFFQQMLKLNFWNVEFNWTYLLSHT
jgi:hypothetical protein